MNSQSALNRTGQMDVQQVIETTQTDSELEFQATHIKPEDHSFLCYVRSLSQRGMWLSKNNFILKLIAVFLRQEWLDVLSQKYKIRNLERNQFINWQAFTINLPVSVKWSRIETKRIRNHIPCLQIHFDWITQ